MLNLVVVVMLDRVCVMMVDRVCFVIVDRVCVVMVHIVCAGIMDRHVVIIFMYFVNLFCLVIGDATW